MTHTDPVDADRFYGLDQPSAAIPDEEWMECDYCELHCPAVGYWRCPKCDTEWDDGSPDDLGGSND